MCYLGHLKKPMHVMKLIFIIYCIGLFWSLLYGSVSWADTKSADYEPSKLPGSSIHLVSRLAEFEIREKQKLEQVLNSKRKEVLVILRKHFKQSTKNGNLEQAIAIRSEIERIEALLVRFMPSRISPTITQYETNNGITKPEEIPVFFYIDGDQAKGRVHLKFKHPKLEQLFNTYDRIELEIQAANTNEAASIGGLLVKHKKKKIGEHIGIKRNEKVLINLEYWKISNIGDELDLVLECNSKDGVVIDTKKSQQTIALVFWKK